MFKKISAVRVLSATELVVWFGDGEVRLFDYQSAFGAEVPAGEVTVEAEGYGIAFADGSEVGCRELYALGIPLDFVRSESKRVISEIVAARHKRGFSQARLASAAGVK